MDEIESIEQAITALEAQRPILGDAVVDTALAPLREKLGSLQPRPDAEQLKLVTVLFADLVGFTAISEHMDPEDIRDIINAYFTRWTTSLEKHGGVVEKFIGDAVMAVFGISLSQEDDPESAIRAALEMRQSLAELNIKIDKSWGLQLAMRVGIHTGNVMVSFMGERKGQDFVVVGDTVNLASRLQSVAPSGGILISHDTFRHVRGSFDVQVLSPIQVKGKEEPIQAYLVMQAKRRTFRGSLRGIEGMETPLVGRDSELAKLKEALLSVLEGRKTQVITVVGEAGIGKSRLIAEFDTWLEVLPQTIRSFKSRASPSMQNRPYSLLRDLFSFSFQIYDSDTPPVVQEKIERGIGEIEYGGQETLSIPSVPGSPNRGLLPESQMRAHFIGQLLGFRFEDSPYLQDVLIDPQILWDRAVTYLIDYFKALASIWPVALLLEDVHWADEYSLEILVRIWEGLADRPLLVVSTTRPTFFESHPEWGRKKGGGKTVFTQIHLASLSPEHSQELVGEILKKVEEVPLSLRNLVVNKAEGNPFFIEELIKMLIEQRVILNEDAHWYIDLSHLEGVRIPSTLVEVLQARFDSLNSEERVFLQRASVLGRVFWDDALSFMDKGQEDQAQIGPRMVDILTNLNTRQMVLSHPNSTFEDSLEFSFVHALLRDVTYDNVLKRLRKIYHGYAAAWLETTTEQSRRSGEYAALIAEHYERADNREKATAWYLRAGDHAADTYANSEGIRCLTRCARLLPEEDIAGKYAVYLKMARLYDVVANRQAQKQDLETLQALAERLDQQETIQDQPEVSRRAQIFLQWWHFYDAVGNLEASAEAAKHAIDVSPAYRDKESETLGNLYLGATLWRKADYSGAQECISKALALARAARSRNLEGDCLRNLGIVQQYQGNHLQARTDYEEALTIYQETANERGESMALNSLGSLLLEQDLYREALPYFERALELKRKIGHRRAENITLLNLGFLAGKLGNFVDALAYLEQVQRFSAETGDRDMEADALNGLGSVALHTGDFAKSKSCLERALNLAQAIGSKSAMCESLKSLSFLFHLTGSDQLAYQYSQDALAMGRELNLPAEQADCLTNAGNALLSLGQLEEASKNFREALLLAQMSSNLRHVIEIQAGLSMAYLLQGQYIQALGMVEEILNSITIKDHLSSLGQLSISYAHLEGMKEPFQVLLICCRVLRANIDPRADPLLSEAHRLLLEQASHLPASPAQTNYLEMIPAHRELQRLYALLVAGPDKDLP